MVSTTDTTQGRLAVNNAGHTFSDLESVCEDGMLTRVRVTDDQPWSSGQSGPSHSDKRRTSLNQRRCCSTPLRIVERDDGKTGSRRVLRALARSRRGRRGRPVFQEPVLGAANSKRRNCPGVRGVLFEVLEASMSAATAMRINGLGDELSDYRSACRWTTTITDSSSSLAIVAAQQASAFRSGRRGRGFKSRHPDSGTDRSGALNRGLLSRLPGRW
jgi:hypothetical protein